MSLVDGKDVARAMFVDGMGRFGRVLRWGARAFVAIVVGIVALACLGAGAWAALRVWELERARPAEAAPSTSAPKPMPPVDDDPLGTEARALRDAMCAYLTDVDHVAERECGRRNLFGLATVIVREVDRMHRNGEWVPVSRRGAPALLAAIVRFEQSWRWNPPRDGRLGEVGIFQLGGAAVRWAGYSADEVRSNPASATRGAILWLDKGRAECADVGTGPETWLGWYATRGVCGGARAEVEKRLEAARWMLRRMEAR